MLLDYTKITISAADYQHLAADIDAAFVRRSAGRDHELADLTAHRSRLEAESDKLLAAHFADAIDLPTLKRYQDRIRAGLADIDQRLATHTEQYAGGRALLHDSLSLLTDAHRKYATLTTPTGASRARPSTSSWRSPKTRTSAHAWPNPSPPSSATTPAPAHHKPPETPNGNTPHLPMSSVPVRTNWWAILGSNQ